MDIQTAARYMQHGYRVRLPSWSDGVFLRTDLISMFAKCEFRSKVRISVIWVPGQEELLSDDWEVITDGIVKDFPLTYADD
jgi:hypothetical protein